MMNAPTAILRTLFLGTAIYLTAHPTTAVPSWVFWLVWWLLVYLGVAVEINWSWGAHPNAGGGPWR